jgi:hypothetical protein
MLSIKFQLMLVRAPFISAVVAMTKYDNRVQHSKFYRSRRNLQITTTLDQSQEENEK